MRCRRRPPTRFDTRSITHGLASLIEPQAHCEHNAKRCANTLFHLNGVHRMQSVQQILRDLRQAPLASVIGSLFAITDPVHFALAQTGDFHVPAGQPSERRHQLHEQMASRTAGRQSAHWRQRGLDRREHHHAVGRYLGDGMVVRLETGRRRGFDAPGVRLVGSLRSDSLAAGHDRILLGRCGSDPCPNAARCGDSPLRR